MNFYQDAYIFLEKLSRKFEENNIFLEPYWNIDHICYRVTSLDGYHELKKEFLNFSKILIESEVNGRPISTFKLDKPIYFENSSIWLVELPAPKPGKETIEGFEHIEVVSDLSFKEIEKTFSHIKADKSGLKKKINQEFELNLGDINLKFHPLSLESLINIEGHDLVFGALKKSQALTLLQEFNPLIAGTFPLGLQTEDSDLDILIQLKDKKSLKDLALKNWENLENFKIDEGMIDDFETMIIKFTLDKIPFEIFAQDLEPVKQKAYRHFLVEERLLKEMGSDFRHLVMRLRKQGLKTEPAFAQALNLSGDPFDALLNLQKKTF